MTASQVSITDRARSQADTGCFLISVGSLIMGMCILAEVLALHEQVSAIRTSLPILGMVLGMFAQLVGLNIVKRAFRLATTPPSAPVGPTATSDQNQQ